MIPCASFVPIALKQLKLEDASLKVATLHCICVMVRAAGQVWRAPSTVPVDDPHDLMRQDITRADLLKPVGKHVQHESPEVRMASAYVFGAMASEMGLLSIGGLDGLKELCFRGLDDANGGVRRAYASALAETIHTAVLQSKTVKKEEKKSDMMSTDFFSSKKNNPATLTLEAGITSILEPFVRKEASADLRGGASEACVALLRRLPLEQLIEAIPMAVRASLSLLAQLKAYDTPEASFHARGCVSYILNSIAEVVPETGKQDVVKVPLATLEDPATLS